MIETYSELPGLVMLELTNKCNMNCDYCFRTKVKIPAAEISWDDFLKIIQRIEFANEISFCGMGEQLLHPQYYEMSDYVQDNKISLLVITNGTIFIDYERLASKSHLKSITISVDGPDEATARKSCAGYNFKNLLDNLDRGTRYEKVYKAVNFVISEDNVDLIIDMLRLLKYYKLNKLNLLLPSYNKKWVKSASAKITEVLNEAKSKSEQLGIELSDPYTMYCMSNSKAIPFITIKGDMRPCCNHLNLMPSAGNLFSKSFDDIWNSRVYSKFNTGAYCSKCEMYKDQSI